MDAYVQCIRTLLKWNRQNNGNGCAYPKLGHFFSSMFLFSLLFQMKIMGGFFCWISTGCGPLKICTIRNALKASVAVLSSTWNFMIHRFACVSKILLWLTYCIMKIWQLLQPSFGLVVFFFHSLSYSWNNVRFNVFVRMAHILEAQIHSLICHVHMFKRHMQMGFRTISVDTFVCLFTSGYITIEKCWEEWVLWVCVRDKNE